MHRSFVPSDQLTPPVFHLSGGHAEHLIKSLRIRPGEPLILLDVSGSSSTYEVKVTAVSRHSITCALVEEHVVANAPFPEIHLVQAITRDGIEDTLRIATSFGVASISPVTTERSVAALSEIPSLNKHRRWLSIIKDEAELAGRTTLPLLSPVQTLSAWVPLREKKHTVIVCDVDPGLPSFTTLAGTTSPLTLIVGPEGGWSSRECALFQEEHFQRLQYGPYTVRSQYAGGIAVAQCRAHVGFYQAHS